MLTVNNKKLKKKTRRFINEVVAFDYYLYVSLYFIITAKYIKYKVNLRNGQKSQDVLVTLYNTTHKVYWVASSEQWVRNYSHVCVAKKTSSKV